MSRKRFTQQPRMTVSKFDSKCAETGKTIKKGQPCLYYPDDKKVYHPDSEQAYQWRCMKDDESMGHIYEGAAPYGAALPYPPVSKLNNIADVLRFFQVLTHKHNVSIHPDDPFQDYVNSEGKPTYTPEQAEELNQMMNLCFNICDDFETEKMGYSPLEQPNLIYVLCIWANEEPEKMILLSELNFQSNDDYPQDLGLVKISREKPLASIELQTINRLARNAHKQGLTEAHLNSPFIIEYLDRRGEPVEFRAYLEKLIVYPVANNTATFYFQGFNKNDPRDYVETPIFILNANTINIKMNDWEFTF